ncbi:MAG: trypsin-like peptidase domain-containing protein [Thiohalocapsa sp.]|jgi:serine protease DegS|uniref:S1C family serine protease n=1 Tax=Thiohalocapsa sp. TaxID=2497641 RepID=UPI0025FC8A1C|nr:trypsin-like peptidase domain-containing protein [Thiohalocapsa sp.]MCG6943386.1 trypsin-like peptidase domain-containing protein [Thiohalocapsa sp.]
MTDRLKMLVAGALGFGLGATAVLMATAVSGRLDGAARAPAPPGPAATASYAEAVARAAPSVLRVFAQHRVPAPSAAEEDAPPSAKPATPQAPPGLSRGSAVVVSDDGLLVTSAHLVAGADAIGTQVPDTGIVTAELLGIDMATDIAVLRLAKPAGPAIGLGDPARLRPGDVVLAIGNPFGLDQTVSLGIVSATGRTHLGLTEIEDFIQTDAAINPGNSGGALIDTSGRLVGINTAIMSDSGYSEGVAFAVPADRVMHVVSEIAATGTVVRGWIGIGARTLDATLAQRFGVRAPGGVFVTRVLEGSPAAAAGLRVGDVIVKAGGQPVASSPALREAVTAAGAGGEILLDVWRGSERLSARVHTRLRPGTHSTQSATPASAVVEGCDAAAAAGC